MIRSNSFTELQNKLTDISGPDGGLQDPRLVSQFVQLMESASSTEEKSILIQSLLETKENSKAVYNRFFSVGGIETLGKWINELVQSSNSEEISVLHRILSCLNKIVVNLDILERTKIYKAVKTICKHSDINLQTKAGALRKKWKEMKQPIEVKPNPIPSDVVAELPAKHPREETLEETEIMENKNDNDEDYSPKRHVRFDEGRLERVKYFWRSDEPNADCATKRPQYVPEAEEHEIHNITDLRKHELQSEKEFNIKEKEKEASIQRVLENMIPKVEYNIDKSNNNIEPLIKNCLRKKTDSLESIEETRRESENMKCVYQRESEIPKMPRDAGASSSLNISVMKIPPFRQGCHIQTISIKEPPQDLPLQNNQIPIESYSPPMNFQFHSLKESEVKSMPPQPTMPMYAPSPMPNPMNPYNPYMMPMAPNPMAPSPMMPMPMMPNSYASPVINPGYYPPMNPVYQPMPGYPPNPLTTNPAMKKPFLINPLTNKPPGFKTLPCRNFHSTIGCARGDNCHFIHDFTFQGRAIPNFEQWKISNEERQKNLPNSKEAMQPIYFPPPPAK